MVVGVRFMVVDGVVKAEDGVRCIMIVDVAVFGNARVVDGVGVVVRIRVVDRLARVVLGVETVIARAVVVDGVEVICDWIVAEVRVQPIKNVLFHFHTLTGQHRDFPLVIIFSQLAFMLSRIRPTKSIL